MASDTPQAMNDFLHNGPVTDMSSEIAALKKAMRDLQTGSAGGGSSDPAGTIKGYGGVVAPSGYLLCDGASYLRTDYPALFATIGTTFGSADGTHFNVPDARGRILVGAGIGTGGGASGTGKPAGGSALAAVTIGDWKGEETHKLTWAEMPSHTHQAQSGSVDDTSAGLFHGAVNATGNWLNQSSAGNDVPHNTIQPELGISFIIKT